MQPVVKGYRRSWLPMALPLLLAGCSSLTYGTGTNTSLQTFQDLTNIANFAGGPRRGEDIAYAPRAGLVIPPTMDLPPAGDPQAQAAVLPVNQTSGDTPGPLGMGTLRGQAPPTGMVVSSDVFFTPTGSYDAAGNPIRIAIVEPPARYRIPDSTVPVTSEGAADPTRPGGSGWSRFWRSLWPF
jgi:hypothetical protein